MTEIWKQIPWMEPGYMASSLGRIKRPELRRTFMRNGRAVSDVRPARCLVGPRMNKKGYARVNLGGRVYLAHRIIAELFVENQEGKPQVNHINGVKSDNRAVNLEWVSNYENRRHAVTHGLHAYGERCAKKLSCANVVRIRSLLAAGRSQREISEEVGISQKTVSNIHLRKAWSRC